MGTTVVNLAYISIRSNYHWQNSLLLKLSLIRDNAIVTAARCVPDILIFNAWLRFINDVLKFEIDLTKNYFYVL